MENVSVLRNSLAARVDTKSGVRSLPFYPFRLESSSCIFAMPSANVTWRPWRSRAPGQGYRVQWGREELLVRVEHLGGDRLAAKRVAVRVQGHINSSDGAIDTIAIQRFKDECIAEELQAASKAEEEQQCERWASGGPSATGNETYAPGAASSAHNHELAGADEDTAASDIAHALRPCSHAVYAKVLRAPWPQDVADGNKFFECVKRPGQFKQLDTGDLFIIGETGAPNLVTAVAEVAHPAITKQSQRSTLYSMVLPERKDDIDEYLGDANSFDYVQLKRIFDVRPMRVTLADLMSRIGANALPTSWQQRFNHVSKDAAVHAKLLEVISTLPCRELESGIDIA